MKKENKWGLQGDFILASCSPQRKRLLQSAGLFPYRIIGADIDESQRPNEPPFSYVKRMALQKAKTVRRQFPNKCILSADTVIVVNRQIVRKAPNEKVARQNLDLISNTRHYVATGYCIIAPQGQIINRVVKTAVKIKALTQNEKEALIASKEWENVAGYRIEGMLSALVEKINGSHPNIVGLPVFEVVEDLKRLLGTKTS